VVPDNNHIDPKPFVELVARRVISVPGLPDELGRCYARHEGVGLESPPDKDIRLCRLDELRIVGIQDIQVFGGDDNDVKWAEFSGFRIGLSPFLDEIVYVLSAPVCGAGAIMIFGFDIAGPGGTGEAVEEPSLVLAPSFSEWFAHLERYGWTEYCLAPGGISELPAAEQVELRSYYRALNPHISWGD